MPMTMTQKILARASKRKNVSVGELLMADLDIVLGNDVSASLAIDELKRCGKDTAIFDKNKIALVPDHFAPNKDIKSATQCQKLRIFANQHEIKNYFEIGKMGIEHALLPERGLIVPGMCIVGGDSHTCTYGALGAFSTGVGSTDLAYVIRNGRCWFKVPSAIKFILFGQMKKYISGKDVILHIIGKIGVNGALYKSMEFMGEGLASLEIDDRFTMANMAIEAGAKNGIFKVDDITLRYVKDHSTKNFEIYECDDDAEYEKTFEIDLSKIEHTVAFPHLPGNTKTEDQWGDIAIDQVVIGSCTNGRLSDLSRAAEVLSGQKIKDGLRVIIIPATQQIYIDALKLGYIEIFMQAGCVVSTPTCGPCWGGHMGVLGEGEKCVSTTNRNFVGRMGHKTSEVFLASPEVAAASALAGKLCAPKWL